MNRLTAYRWFLIGVVLMLAGCAGGGETGSGATGKDASHGTITAMNNGSAPRSIAALAPSDPGTLTVNGITFEMKATRVTMEGEPATRSVLRLGMVVTVKGTINGDGLSGTAEQIFVEEVLKGPVSTMGTNTLMVLGQTVQITEATRFEEPLNVLTDVQVGDFVEISGVVKSAGGITATRIERIAAPSAYQLKGIISNTQAALTQFNIGSLVVNYAGVSELPPATPVDGQYVEVKGTIISGNNFFTATQIELEELDVEDAEKFELEGFVSIGINTKGEFSVGNVPVRVTPQTNFEGGVQADVVGGVEVEVEGALVAGVLNATTMEFKESIKLESNVESVTGSALTLQGLGITVSFDNFTQMDDGVPGVGAHVKVQARKQTSGMILATRIETETENVDDVILQGPVDQLNNPMITILLSLTN